MYVQQVTPNCPGILVGTTLMLAQGSTRANAEAIIARLASPSELRKVLPEAAWHPQLVFVTQPILVSHNCQGPRAPLGSEFAACGRA